MYEQFFNLKETPFSIAPNPHYLYMSRQHHEALAHLIYGVGRDGGFVLLTGEVGTGKTTVCRCFLEQVPEDTDVAFVLNPKLNVEELLATICDELSIPYIDDSVSIKDYVDCINIYLLRQHAVGRHTVLIIDEAQNLSPDVLEQLRLLTNLETHEKKLLQIVLLGQPELQEMFRQPELRQLSQRVTARFHLNAMQQEEVGPYVYHRLAIAGAAEPRSVFPAAVIARLHEISKGIPRVINLVCDRALLGAYARETKTVDLGILNTAANEVLGTDFFGSRMRRQRQWHPAAIGGIAGALVASLVAVAVVMFSGSGEVPPAASVAVVESPAESAETDSPPPSVANTSELAEGATKKTESAEDLKDVASPETIAATANPTPVAAEPAVAKPIALVDLLQQVTAPDEAAAYVDLFKTWKLAFSPRINGDACKHAESLGLACLRKTGNLGSVKHLGVPVVLKLHDQQGTEKYLVVSQLQQGNVASVYLNGEELQADVSDLDTYWRGDFSLLWKKPPSYHGPLQPGAIAPMSKWLAYQLDVWEKKPNPAMGRSSYDPVLVERVKAFQRFVGEADDGVVGASTLIQLSRRVDESVPALVAAEGGS
ncbi:MAG TPA: AAA family ATPase [Dongiaceae bacterium]|nr:AAA family ATPase [Dongiaceae bacterium]